MPTTRGTSTSFTLQSAVRLGPCPTKYETSWVARQWPLSSRSRPSRHTTRLAEEYWYEYGGNDSGVVPARASWLKTRQMSAGNVPPATAWPWYSVSIGLSRFGYPTHTAVASCGVYPTNHASP